jgi:tetratricopeptide (TPR) repeat protein
LNDYEESIRRTLQLLQIYPNATNSWVSLSNLYDRLGEYPQAIDAAARASQLDPQSSVATVELARSYLRASRFAEATEVADTAVKQGKDHWDVHSILFQIAFIEHDVAKRKQEGEWGLTHQHANTSLCDMGLAAATEGKLHEATDDLARARDAALRDGEADFAEGVLLHAARIQLELGASAQAALTLKQIKASQGDPSDPGELAYLRASTGDVVAAQRFAEAAEADENHNTVMVNIYVPLLRALLALKSHKPEEAVRLLEPARVYQLRDFSVPMLRAEAEVAAGMLDAAAQDYRLILDHPGVDPISPLYPLARLHLARVLVHQRRMQEGRREYQSLLDGWKEADPDLKLAAEARHEMAELH